MSKDNKQKENTVEYKYKIDKKVFIITPVYRNSDSAKTLDQILLELIKNEVKNLCK